MTPTELGNITIHLSHVLSDPVYGTSAEELHESRDHRSAEVPCVSGSNA